MEEARNAAVDAESARVYGAQQHAAELERAYEALRRAQARALACSGVLAAACAVSILTVLALFVLPAQTRAHAARITNSCTCGPYHRTEVIGIPKGPQSPAGCDLL